MAKLLQPFDPNLYQLNGGGGQFTVGEHLVTIEHSEVKATKNNDGGYIEFALRSDSGESGAYRINLYNKNQQAVEIAQRQFASLLAVTVGNPVIEQTEELHGIPFTIIVGPQKVQPGQEDRGYTEVKQVRDAAGNNPHREGPQAPQGGQQQQQGGWGGGQPQQQQQQQPAQQQSPWGGQPQQQPEQLAQQPAQSAPWGQQSQPQQTEQQPQQGGAPWGQQSGGTTPPWGQQQG